MICKQCQDNNMKSQVSAGLSLKEACYYPPYWDEEGKYHNHDGNVITTSYRCSNNHTWTEHRTGSCWCGWGNSNDRI